MARVPRKKDFFDEKRPRFRKYRGKSARVLAEWRGFREPDDTTAFEHDELASVLKSTLKHLGLENRLDETQVLSAWNELVGEFVAQNSRPLEVRHRVLYIQVLQSAVHYTLERMKGDILARFQQRFGPDRIRDVRFRLG